MRIKLGTSFLDDERAERKWGSMEPLSGSMSRSGLVLFRVISMKAGRVKGTGSVDRLTLLSELPSWPLISGFL